MINNFLREEQRRRRGCLFSADCAVWRRSARFCKQRRSRLPVSFCSCLVCITWICWKKKKQTNKKAAENHKKGDLHSTRNCNRSIHSGWYHCSLFHRVMGIWPTITEPSLMESRKQVVHYHRHHLYFFPRHFGAFSFSFTVNERKKMDFNFAQFRATRAFKSVFNFPRGCEWTGSSSQILYLPSESVLKRSPTEKWGKVRSLRKDTIWALAKYSDTVLNRKSASSAL